MNGVLPLYKERGMTSFDCIRRLRQLLHTKKIGHSGTLDPDVSGVLPICLGSATKLVPFLMASGKVYAGELTIGFATTTEDLSGETVEKQAVSQPISDQAVKTAMSKLTGTITQIPPMYSAVKVNGKRLYEYARAHETVERPRRQVTIKSFVMLSNHYDEQHQQQVVRFKVECSKGTYIRTLAVDLARQLGYPGVMSSLTRLKSGGFELDQTLSLDDVEEAVNHGAIENYVFPITYVLRDYPQVKLTNEQWQAVQNGGWLTIDEIKSEGSRILLTYQGQAQAIYERDGKHYEPLKMLLTKVGD